MDQKDIYRSANLLIDEYGSDAAAHAGRRIQEMIGRGDMQGAGVWRRVLRAIGDLQGSGGRARH